MKKPAFYLRHILLLYIFIFSFSLTLPPFARPVYAAMPASIRSCELTGKTKMAVKVSIPDTSKVPGNRVYLFSVPMTRSKLSSQDKPIASASKQKTVTLQVKFKSSALQEALSRQYLVGARKSDGKYVALTGMQYITNASKAAKYTYTFPQVPSKKGLQVNWEMQEDALELNVHHSVLNIVLSDIPAAADEQNESASISYKFGQKTYWFRRSVISSYDEQLKQLSAEGVLISGILLLGYRSDTLNLIYPGARQRGHNFYAWNYQDAAARQTFQAMISFLAQRYSPKNGSHGRIVNWIVGNEVNNHNAWNYAGKQSLSSYSNIYANAFRLTYNAVTSVYANARVYISLDHLWNAKQDNSFTAHEMLDAFAERIRIGGQIKWNLAYHPYGSPLTEPKFWENKNRQVISSLSSPVINMNNLSVLTSYIRKTYGSSTRIILSEQGYTSRTSYGDTQKEQAAAIAYSYYVTESDDMVDAFIMNRHVDHQVEIDQGLNLGLWTTSGTESADKKKKSWKVFKYMDTSLSQKVTSDSLKVIGAKSWSSLVDGFSKKTYSKTDLKQGKLVIASDYRGGKAIASGWSKYGAASAYQKSGSAMHVQRASDVNKNRLWGIAQQFRKTADFSTTPVICLTVNITGATAGKAVVKLRFYSDNQIFECEKAVPTGGNIKLSTSLAGWSGLKKVKRIQVLIARSSGGWDPNASATISNIRGIKK